MNLIKFLKDEEIYNVKIVNFSNRLKVTFDILPLENVYTQGFVVVNEHNGKIMGHYEDYKYVYKLEDDGITLILTTDPDDVYVAPPEPEPIPEPTPEEIAERERQNQIYSLNSQINSLKTQLQDTDYQIIKTYEYSLVGKESEYDIESLHKERDTIRFQINELEAQLEELYESV